MKSFFAFHRRGRVGAGVRDPADGALCSANVPRPGPQAARGSSLISLRRLHHRRGLETLRELVLTQPMDPLTESLLVFAARRDHIAQVIAPALARGEVVLCDRFTDATFAYQGAGRGFDAGVLRTLEGWVQAGENSEGGEGGALLQPDLTFWFDLPPDVAAERLASARVPDRFEAQPAEFFRRVAAGYAARAASQPRFERIDAAQPRAQVWAQVEAALRRRGLAG